MEPDDYYEVTDWVCYHVQRCNRCGKIINHHNRNEAQFPCPDRPSK